MKKLILPLLFILLNLSAFGQTMELSASINTSSEDRFQNASGTGLQFQQSIGHKSILGIGTHFNFSNSKFTVIPYNDADPRFHAVDRINSYSKRISVRINIQQLIKDNELYSIGIGPEISYNWLWGYDKVHEYVDENSDLIYFTRDNETAGDLGFGLISKFELKQIFIDRLSLCITVRPEFLVGKDYNKKGFATVFTGDLRFLEMQLGLKYNLGN